jgi:hypothetical protein
MSLLDGLKAMNKLKELLSERNLDILNDVLTGLVDDKLPSFNPFWEWLRTRRDEKDLEPAWRALVRLREILAEYRREG